MGAAAVKKSIFFSSAAGVVCASCLGICMLPLVALVTMTGTCIHVSKSLSVCVCVCCVLI